MPESELNLLLDANQTFYGAFEARDINAMTAIWEGSSRALCTHPGRVPIHGWTRIAASWYRLFTNPERLQFLITGQVGHVVGEVGWVSCEEDFLQGAASGRHIALNLFVQDESGAWLMVAHIASPALV